jgi:hypothetical protein
MCNTFLGIATGLFSKIKVGIFFDKVTPFPGDFIFREDRSDGTDRLAGITIYTLIRIDVEHIIPFVKALNGANLRTIAILAIYTGFAYNISHAFSPLITSILNFMANHPGAAVALLTKVLLLVREMYTR